MKSFIVEDANSVWDDVWREVEDYRKRTGRDVKTTFEKKGMRVTAPDDEAFLLWIRFGGPQ